MFRLIPIGLIAAWFAFAGLAPRLVSAEWVSVLALAGMAVTVLILANTGRVNRPDPLALNLTARRPYWETRQS